MDQTHHLPTLNSYSISLSVNSCLVFYLKVFLYHTEALGRGQIDPSFPLHLFGNNRQHMPVCAKIVSSWLRKVISTAMAQMSLGTL